MRRLSMPSPATAVALVAVLVALCGIAVATGVVLLTRWASRSS